MEKTIDWVTALTAAYRHLPRAVGACKKTSSALAFSGFYNTDTMALIEKMIDCNVRAESPAVPGRLCRCGKYARKLLQVIRRRSKGLLEFVENYRKLTRIAPPVKTAFFIRQFFADLQRLYADASFHFILPDEQLTLYADRPQLEQVFINLLKNAREACSGTEHPRIETTVSASRDTLTFTVTDNGEGMLPEVTERIFVPFFTTKPNGSGIGLNLCKQIISLHGGQIAVQSEPGKGSRFILTLPKQNEY